ncbi:hypothetical protein [Rhizobium etli]|uniref:Uncharacterized protein n=1 Tax=Rhizobium etli TaxID=29449 RepID=A0A7W6ZCX1_RHIET|nr:hypothetical protein [Rhizobium etli]MBB4477952.1 hypothetical protein [Rhizobium etli]MBB4533784.1 hypothetical protein [Rhizobium etli]
MSWRLSPSHRDGAEGGHQGSGANHRHNEYCQVLYLWSSSASTILSSAASTSSSVSSDDLASLEAQLAEKQAALSQTQDEQEKATIEKSIETLEAKIAKIEATESGKGQASASPAAAAPGACDSDIFSGAIKGLGNRFSICLFRDCALPR